MATLANVYQRVFAKVREEAEAPPRIVDASIRLRAFANEDVYFYVKRLDNSRVVRAADPAARGACWKLIGTTGAAVILLIGVLLPSAYGLLAGYQIQSLRLEGQRLITEQAALELEEARLLSPARIEALARQQQFVNPAPAKIVYLENKNEEAKR
jgi:hypothetical protein